MSTIVQIAHGWEARQAIAGGGATPVGNRAAIFGQNAIFVDVMLSTYGGEGDDQCVDFAKWLMGGVASGTVWVSSFLDDYSYWISGATAVKEVGTTTRNALTAAGFTVHESTDTDDEITYPAYDIAIVGSPDSFGQLLADDPARSAQLVDFVNDGGGLMLTKSNVAATGSTFMNNIETDLGLTSSGAFINTGSALAYLTGATALNPVLFPSGRTVWRRYSNWVGVNVEDANHGEYSLDGFSNPYRQYATYSAHGDA